MINGQETPKGKVNGQNKKSKRRQMNEKLSKIHGSKCQGEIKK